MPIFKTGVNFISSGSLQLTLYVLVLHLTFAYVQKTINIPEKKREISSFSKFRMMYEFLPFCFKIYEIQTY